MDEIETVKRWHRIIDMALTYEEYERFMSVVDQYAEDTNSRASKGVVEHGLRYLMAAALEIYNGSF